MDPCGTPHLIGIFVEFVPFKDTVWCRSDKYDANQSLATPLRYRNGPILIKVYYGSRCRTPFPNL